MLLFLILLLPVAFLTYAYIQKDRSIILPSFAGLITGTVVCACRFFFSYEHRLIYFSFSENFIYYLVKQSLLPLLIVTAVYALVSKDTAEYKIKNFFPLMCPFYTVYLPYCVITGSEVYYLPYDLFLKPFIYLAMVVQIALCLNSVYNNIKNKKIVTAVLNSLIIILFAIYPAISDALYSIDFSFALILILGIAYSAIPAVYYILSKLLVK